MKISVLHPGDPEFPGDLEFPTVDHPDVDLRGPDDRRPLIEDARGKTSRATAPQERAAWATVAIMGSARDGHVHDPGSEALGALVDWMREDVSRTLIFWLTLHAILPRAVPDLTRAILTIGPDAVGSVNFATAVVQGETRAEIRRQLATHALDSVREYYFALLGQHRRLVPPGSTPTNHFEPGLLAEVLRSGVTDTVAKVRERAIAAAYGMNAIALVRDEVMAATDDPVMDVRQYALVALGILDDDASLARLRDRLHHGTQPEMTSAIWALARRRDGLGDVLSLVSDDRVWLRHELLRALAEVAAPMTDAQLDAVRAAIADPDLDRLLDRHLDRTRRGGREHGSDGQWIAVRTRPPEAENERT